MAAETDLATLLREMRPVLDDRPFVFASVGAETAATLGDRAVGLFHEREGVTLILPRREADSAGLAYNAAWARITLSVHSDLSAVGFLAAVTARLAAAGLSVNAVSAYYHDHLFVPYATRDEAMAILTDLSRSDSSSFSEGPPGESLSEPRA